MFIVTKGDNHQPVQAYVVHTELMTVSNPVSIGYTTYDTTGQVFV